MRAGSAWLMPTAEYDLNFNFDRTDEGHGV